MFEPMTLSLALLSLTAPAEAGTPSTEEAEIIRVQHAACAAFEKGDAAVLARYLDPGFTLTDSRGHVTGLEENLAEVRNREPRYEIFRNHDMKTRMYGSAAVVIGVTSIKGTAGGEPFAAVFQFTDTMVKRRGQWRLAASHATRIPPPKAPAAAGTLALSLYRRLGGYDVLAGVVDDWFARQAKDPRFARFGAGLSRDARRKVRQDTVDFLCQLIGGPCFYVGRDMKAAHAGLGVTAEAWEAQLIYLDEAADKLEVPAQEKDELRQVIEGLRGAVVEQGND